MIEFVDAPAVFCAAPAPVIESVDAPAVFRAAQAPVIESVDAPAVFHAATALVIEFVDAPAVFCAAPAPVIESVDALAVFPAAPALVNEFVASSTAVAHAAPASAPPRRLRKKTKQKAYSDDDSLERAIQQADEERAMEADVMMRVWNKEPEQCQCGRSPPSRVDGEGD